MPTLSPEEIASRGERIYQKRRSQLERESFGKILVIDIETGHYELDTDHHTAVQRARTSHPNALLFGLRIGSPVLSKRGGTWPTTRRSA
jgi:hypothetical protein